MISKQDLKTLASYFVRNNIQVVALSPGLKYPTYENWHNIRLSEEQLHRAIDANFTLGIKPNNDFLYVDLDDDHGDYKGSDGWQGNFTQVETVTATKANSSNLHLFYKNTYKLSLRLTGDNAILDGVDIATCDSQIRTLPAYVFANLDLTRPFVEQLADCPPEIDMLRHYGQKQYKPKKKKRTKHDIYKYLQAVPPFETGSRSSSYRTLVYTMVISCGMEYDKVYDAIVDWDKAGIDYQSEEPSQFYHAIREPKQ